MTSLRLWIMWISKGFLVTTSSSNSQRKQTSMRARINPSNQWHSRWAVETKWVVETWVWLVWQVWVSNSQQIISEITCSSNSNNNNQLWVDSATSNNHSKTTKINSEVSNKLHKSHHLVGSNLNNKPSHNSNSVASISRTKIHSETFKVPAKTTLKATRTSLLTD